MGCTKIWIKAKIFGPIPRDPKNSAVLDTLAPNGRVFFTQNFCIASEPDHLGLKILTEWTDQKIRKIQNLQFSLYEIDDFWAILGIALFSARRGVRL